MDTDHFLAALGELIAGYQRDQPEIGCIQTTGSIACADCVFCSDCERCFAAQYSIRCRDSFDITHCKDCSNCYACTFSQHSRHCAYSNYVIHSVGCIHCDYCFGCVGLEKKAFHILNRKYSRKEYFKLVKQLERDLFGAS
ncbi:MAG: hypothetical protein Tsb0020_05340 [Haliangiales bacterium]